MPEHVGRILVVDDEPGMREGCRRILTPEGHAVEVAESGERALEMVAPGRFDLALIDLKMPGMSGLELLVKLRQLDPDLVCIMVTAYATLETAVQATKKGAYDYLAKPFTPEELVPVVEKALERRWLALAAARFREEAERNLLLIATEQSRTRTIIQSMADGVLATNREGNLVLHNPAALRLLGVKGELPALGQPPSRGLFPAELLGLMDEALSGGESRLVTRELPGGPPNLAASVAAIRDEDDHPLGAVAVLRDITQLKSLNQAMGDFVTMVAHELRAPLAAMVQYFEVILGGITSGQPEKEKEILTRCRERAQALCQLVADLLDFSRNQRQAEMKRDLRPLDLVEIVQSTVQFLSPRAEERNLRIALELPSSPPLIDADRDEIGQLLTNLLDNAIKYNREGGSVTVRVSATDGYLSIEVSDTGLGISQAGLGRLGEAFFRVKTPQTRYITGTGLGLSICKQIIEAHHGHLEVESEEGKGSTFRVLLPRSGGASAEG